MDRCGASGGEVVVLYQRRWCWRRARSGVDAAAYGQQHDAELVRFDVERRRPPWWRCPTPPAIGWRVEQRPREQSDEGGAAAAAAEVAEAAEAVEVTSSR